MFRDRPPGYIAFVRIVSDETIDEVAQKIEMLLEVEPTFEEVQVEGFLD